MTFSSLVFLFLFLPVTFLLYWVIRSQTARNVLLVCASLLFYAFGEPLAVLLMVGSIVANYLLGRACTHEKYAKVAVAAAIVLNIGLLFVFKYLGFLVTTFNAVTALSVPVPVIRLPIGISFFTFQGLSYVIDVYRDRDTVQRDLLAVFLYISFFPQLIAGPIVKYHDIAPQLYHREFTADRVFRGVSRFIVGLGKKVLIADQMGLVADLVFDAPVGEIGAFSAWVGAVCYLFQIFYDFSGYSDMAIGLGCIFGFDFKENFCYPYTACSIKDFWRRWHISLSTWFREYVYIPLGGNRRGKARANLNRLIVFFLTGLWHGANLTFIVWGLLHGAFMLLEGCGIIPTEKKWFRPFGHVYTLLVVTLTFVLFRADTLSQGFSLLGRMCGAAAGSAGMTAAVLARFSPAFVLALVLAAVFSMPVAPKLRRLADGRAASVAAYVTAAGTLLIFLLCVLCLVSGDYDPFIYFRF